MVYDGPPKNAVHTEYTQSNFTQNRRFFEHRLITQLGVHSVIVAHAVQLGYDDRELFKIILFDEIGSKSINQNVSPKQKVIGNGKSKKHSQ